MAREVGAIVVGVVVGYFAGPQAGLAAASLVYGLTAPNAKQEGPKLSDLKAPQAAYGAPIFYLEGSPRIAGNYIYASDKRQVANESSAGKGGPGVDTTLYTYEMDVLILLSINQQAAVTRIWSNGRLVWNKGDTADLETMISSGVTNSWREIRFYSGDADQMPDPTYEAAVGVGNAPAYRGRASIFIEGLNLGQSGQLPVLTLETCSEGDSSFSRIGANEDIGITFAADDAPGAGPAAIVGLEDALRIISIEDSAVHVFGLDGSPAGTEIGSFGGFPGPRDPGLYNSYPVGMLAGVPIRAQNISQAIGGAHPVLPIGTMNAAAAAIDGVDLASALPAGEYVGGVTLSSGNSALIYTSPTNAEAGTETVDKWYLVSLENDGGSYVVTLEDQGALAVPASIYTFGFGSCATFHFAASTLTADLAEVWVAYGGAASLSIYEFDAGVLTLREAFSGTGGILGPPFSYPSIYVAGDVGVVVAGDTITFWSRTITPTLPTLDQVVSRLCLRTGLLTADDIDVTDLEDDTVRALAVTQVGPTRSTLESLMAGFLFGSVEGEKIKFVKRGGTSVATIPYVDMGASTGDPIEPLPLRRLNDIELPAQVTIKYANTTNDFQDGAESGDRLVTQSTAVQVVELPIGFTPTEAKRIADANTMDLAVSLIGLGPVSVGRKYAHLEPTDVVTLVGKDDSTFRARIQKATAAGGINTFELVLDDASVIHSVASTDSNYASSTLVRAISTTDLELLDIPILRDADDSPGKYAAFGARTPWSGAALYDSDDNVAFSKVLETAERTITGGATTTLGDFTVGNVFDEVNSLTVTVNGALSSVTNSTLLTSTANALLVGSEIIQYRDATLVSANTYTLTGLLRGRRGTEWAMPDHVASERVVVLQATGLRRVLDEQADIGIERFYKAVSIGKSVSAVSAEAFTNTGVSDKPFSPVDLRMSTSGANLVLTWKRRTRYATNFTGAAGIVVLLGEASERYEVDIFNGVTLLRTVSSTTQTITYTRAQQAADGAGTSTLTFVVYQIGRDGRGYGASTSADGLVTLQPQISTVTVGGTYASGAALYVTLNSTRFDYTSTVGDATLSGIATSLAALIDANASYTASAVGAVITITGPMSTAFTIVAGQGGDTAVSFSVVQNAAAVTAGVREEWSAAFHSDGEVALAGPTGFFIAAQRTTPDLLRVYTTYSDRPSWVDYSAYVYGDLVTNFVTSGDQAAYDLHLFYDSFHGNLAIQTPIADPSNWTVTAYCANSLISATVGKRGVGVDAVPVARAQITTATLSGTPATGQVWRLTLGGVNYDYPAIGGDTLTNIATGLAAVVDAAAAYVSTSAGPVVTITASATATAFTYSAAVFASTVTLTAATTQPAY